MFRILGMPKLKPGRPRKKAKKQQLSVLDKAALAGIGEKLKALRVKAGYTSYEYFAYDVEISRAQYGKYEAGANMRLDNLLKILRFHRVRLEDFFKGLH
jgi:hypothetical protein